MKTVIHTGFHKTGTTALQAYFATNRDALLQNGFCYPNFSKLNPEISEKGHFFFANEIANTTGQIEPLKNFLVQESINSNVLFLSAESISRHTFDYSDDSIRKRKHAFLVRLAQALPSPQVEIMATLRNPYRLIDSHYQEFVKKTFYSKPFSEYLGVYFESYDPVANLTLWNQIFDRVSVRGYESDCKHEYGIAGAVLSDYAPHFKPEQGTESLNVSLSTLSIEVLRRLNPHLEKHRGKRDVLDTLMNHSREGLDEGRKTFWTRHLLSILRSKIQGDFDFISDEFNVELDTSLPSGKLGARFNQDVVAKVIDSLSELIDSSVLSSISHDLC